MVDDSQSVAHAGGQKRKPGRPRVGATSAQVRELLQAGFSLHRAANELNIGLATAGRLRDATSTEVSQNSPGPSQNSCRARSEDIPRPDRTQPPEPLHSPEPAMEDSRLQPEHRPEPAEPSPTEDAADSEDDATGGIRPISIRRQPRPIMRADERKPTTTDDRWRPYDGGPLPPCPKCGLRRHRVTTGWVICDFCFPLRNY